MTHKFYNVTGEGAGKRYILFALLLITTSSSAQGVIDSSRRVYDTVPTSMAVYTTSMATSILIIRKGYTVYCNDEYTFSERCGNCKDSILTMVSFWRSPWFFKYLGADKKPIADSLAIWKAIDQRESILQPPKGL